MVIGVPLSWCVPMLLRMYAVMQYGRFANANSLSICIHNGSQTAKIRFDRLHIPIVDCKNTVEQNGRSASTQFYEGRMGWITNDIIRFFAI